MKSYIGTNKNYKILKDGFLGKHGDCKPFAYLKLAQNVSDAEIIASVKKYADLGIGCVIPTVSITNFNWNSPEKLLHIYEVLLRAAEENKICAAINAQSFIEEAFINNLDEDGCERLKSRILIRRAFYCKSGEPVRMRINDDTLSITALEEKGEKLDLHQFVVDGFLKWTAPKGNWNIYRYICQEDANSTKINKLNYKASQEYIVSLLEMFFSSNEIRRHIGKELCFIVCSDVCFSSPNRRDWDEGFDELFKSTYGYSPKPYYPMLYDCPGDNIHHYKAQLMDIRAKMLRLGFVKAFTETAETFNLTAIVGIAEPKLTACSMIVGDTSAMQSDTAYALLNKAYLYGINSVMLASGAAHSIGKDTVVCEAFRDYCDGSQDKFYREASIAFARGANMFLLHLNDDYGQEDTSRFIEYVSRLQSVLQGGAHVSDIALLYPIYSLHSNVCLYEAEEPSNRFIYPDTPDTADYMTVINSITSYSGHDLTVLHPEAFDKYCYEENGKISLENAKGAEEYKVLIFPAAELISLKNLKKIKQFYDHGGKIIATGILPKYSLEFSEEGSKDCEIISIIDNIFGAGASSDKITNDYIYNSNENGGEAYFLYSTTTGIDRTCIVSGAHLYTALSSFKLPLDVIIEKIPRFECTGALNNNYPQYELLGLSRMVLGGGMLNYTHKKFEDCEAYYFANSTDMNYDVNILLRGLHKIEKWNPLNREIYELPCSYTRKNGTAYTKVRVNLESATSTLLVSHSSEPISPDFVEN